MSTKVFYPSWIIDGTGNAPMADHAVVTNSGVITAISPVDEVNLGTADQGINLDGMTLLPGLINNHVHLVLPGDYTHFVPWIENQADVELALLAAHNAEKSLRSGVTTVRDCGGRGTIVLKVRDAQARGLVRGSRIISCGWPVTITGGHCRQFGGEADGVDAVRQMVRKVIGEGADYVKVMASGGGTPGSLPQYPSFSVPELEAIVEEAHSLGRLVAAHANPKESIANCLEAGVDLIEHAAYFGSNFDLEEDYSIARKLGEAAIPVTATLGVSRDLVDILPEGPLLVHRLKYGEAQRRNMKNLHDLGAQVLAGSDAGWLATGFDTFWKELDELVRAGMTPIEAVHAATGAVSQALGFADSFGTIRPGLAADLIAVNGELASDISLLSSVQLVFQSGDLVYSAPR